MSIGSQTQTESTYLSSSVSSLHRSRKSTSEISKTYKHASQLYLTRRLVECYDALQPVIRPPPREEKENGHLNQSEDESTSRAPIASATTSQRIKIWSLYVTLLNTIIELGDEEGKRDFGNKIYRELVRNVQSGEVWQHIVKDGYMGREDSVDAEVVYNLSNLLLAQAPDQIANQGRLETYLSSSPHGNLDFSTALQNGNSKRSNGMDTPKDLNSRIKILELFTLHVLPRNNEWDYARSFVSNSDILDEERREAFLQTLNELQEVKEQEEAEAQTEDDLVGFAEETDEEIPEQDQIRMNDEDEVVQDTNDNPGTFDTTPTTRQITSPPTKKSLHRRTSSEVDYGIEDDFHKSRKTQAQQQPQYPPAPLSQPRSTATTKATSTRTLSPTPIPNHSLIPTPTSSISAPPPSSTSSISPPPPRKPSAPAIKKAATSKVTPSKSNKSSSRIPKIIRLLANLTSSIAHSLTRNPTQVFRTLMFLIAMLAVLARRDVRERLRRVIGHGWGKVMETAGMGVRVSYV